MVLKCNVCGHIEKCCVIDCSQCGGDMIQLEGLEAKRALAKLEPKVGDPLVPESVRTQCKFCGKRKPLFLVTEPKPKGGLVIGICKECYLEGED